MPDYLLQGLNTENLALDFDQIAKAFAVCRSAERLLDALLESRLKAADIRDLAVDLYELENWGDFDDDLDKLERQGEWTKATLGDGCVILERPCT